MLKLKLQLEKTLMLGKIEGRTQMPLTQSLKY